MSQDIICPVCAGAGGIEFKNQVGQYRWQRCRTCGGEFVIPLRAGDATYYGDTYGAEGGGYGLKKWEYQEFFCDAQRHGWQGNLLDVGCGSGWFLGLARGQGFTVYGIDFNRAAIAAAQSKGITNAKVGSVAELRQLFPGVQFNLAVIFHVLEHLDDPYATLMALRTVLAPAGRIVISVPNRERTILKLNIRKKREGWDEPPHHLTRWNLTSLRSILERSGFIVETAKEERLTSLAQAFAFARGLLQLWTSTGLVAGLHNAPSVSAVNRPTLKRALSRNLVRFKGLLLLVPTLLLTPLVYLAAQIITIRGTNLYVVARAE